MLGRLIKRTAMISFILPLFFDGLLEGVIAQDSCPPSSMPAIDQLADIRAFLERHRGIHSHVLQVHDRGDLLCIGLGEKVCEEELKGTENSIEKVDAFLTPMFKKPRPLYVLVQEPDTKEDGISERNGADPLVGFQVYNRLPYPAEDASSGLAAIIIHEYAHQYFAENAYPRVHLEDGTTLYDLMKKKNEVTFRDQLGARRMKLAILREGQSEAPLSANSEYRALADKDTDTEEGVRLRMRSQDNQSKLIRAANELFADTVAVILLSDPAVITKGITGLVPEEARGLTLMATLEARRFDLNHAPLTAATGEKREYVYMSFSSVHTALAPTRFHLWKYHLSQAKTDDEKRKVLQAIIDAAIQMETELQANNEIVHDIDHFSLNRRFIQFFEKAMGTENPILAPDASSHAEFELKP